jgi:hypothetical protein
VLLDVQDLSRSLREVNSVDLYRADVVKYRSAVVACAHDKVSSTLGDVVNQRLWPYCCVAVRWVRVVVSWFGHEACNLNPVNVKEFGEEW